MRNEICTDRRRNTEAITQDGSNLCTTAAIRMAPLEFACVRPYSYYATYVFVAEYILTANETPTGSMPPIRSSIPRRLSVKVCPETLPEIHARVQIAIKTNVLREFPFQSVIRSNPGVTDSHIEIHRCYLRRDKLDEIVTSTYFDVKRDTT